MKGKIALILLSLAAFLNSKGQTSETLKSEFKPTGFIDFNGYYDTREYSVLTINMLGNLGKGFQYFSLTNYEGPNNSSDVSTFYSEQNVRWNIHKKIPVDLTLQYVMRQNNRNDDWRLGLRFRLNNIKGLDKFFGFLKMRYSANPMFVQFREGSGLSYMPIIEHVYNIKLYKNRIYLGGFWDQNFVWNNEKLSFKHVSEHQLGVMMFKNFYAVIEYRINTFWKTNQYGLGYGLEYKIAFN